MVRSSYVTYKALSATLYFSYYTWLFKAVQGQEQSYCSMIFLMALKENNGHVSHFTGFPEIINNNALKIYRILSGPLIIVPLFS